MLATIGCLSVGLLFGFVLPGWYPAKLLGSRLLPVAAFMISLTLLYQVVFWLGMAGVPIRFSTVLPVLVAVTAIAAGLWHRRARPAAPPDPAPPEARAAWHWQGAPLWVWLPLAAFVLVAACRLGMAPLSGPDIQYRWEYLGKLLMQYEHFDYYPPVTAADYRVYTMNDGIAPLVSFSYYWLYVSWGAAWRPLTSLLVVAQLLAVGCLCWGIARALFSTTAAWLAVVVLASSQIMLWAVGIAQENGLTAIGLGGVVYFLVSARDDDRRGAAVLAGVAAAIGTLAREYGGYILVCGVVCAWWRRYRWRDLALFVGVTALLAAPWYLRTWYLTGNPYHSIRLGHLFWVNPVHDLFMREIGAEVGFSANLRYQALAFAVAFTLYAGLPLVLGIVGGLRDWRRHGDLLLCSLLGTLVWVASVSRMSVNSYTERVLSPVLVVLAALAGGWLAANWGRARTLLFLPLSLAFGGLAVICLLDWQLLRPNYWPLALLALALALGAALDYLLPAQVRPALVVALLAALLRNLVYAGVFPERRIDFPLAAYPGVLTYRHDSSIAEVELLAALRGRTPPGFRILSDNSYVHALFAGSGTEIAIIWSPEVRFIFDPAVSAAAATEQLKQLGIGAVLYYPGSTNTRVLDRQRFYAEGKPTWRLALKQRFWELYLLPGVELAPEADHH